MESYDQQMEQPHVGFYLPCLYWGRAPSRLLQAESSLEHQWYQSGGSSGYRLSIGIGHVVRFNTLPATSTHAQLNIDREVLKIGSNFLLDSFTAGVGCEVDVGLNCLDLFATESGLNDKVGELGTSYNDYQCTSKQV